MEPPSCWGCLLLPAWLNRRARWEWFRFMIGLGWIAGEESPSAMHFCTTPSEVPRGFSSQCNQLPTAQAPHRDPHRFFGWPQSTGSKVDPMSSWKICQTQSPSLVMVVLFFPWRVPSLHFAGQSQQRADQWWENLQAGSEGINGIKIPIPSVLNQSLMINDCIRKKTSDNGLVGLFEW